MRDLDRNALDRYITGNYGEDQFSSRPDAWCSDCYLPLWEHGGHWLDDTDNHHDGHNVTAPIVEVTE